MKLILLVGLITLSISINAKPTVRGEMIKLLPSELSALTNKSTEGEIEKAFKAKIRSKDKDAIYLQDQTTIGIKKSHFHYVYVVATQEMKEKTKGLFRQVYSNLYPQEKARIQKSLSETDHTAGSTITMEVPGENLKLEFINNESKTLRSMVIWPMDGDHP
ncbi:hypothetical protein [Peredibacter starrii]|uniref:Uncharacterized protein n=1 Tax=Peredibacter starrii TaxID=28202 RepID=A0AAX4HQP5_9BACT|nr:hypothetical protein [Peredibacter starrii]WPU65487.1 hypothetical protein SOO65_01880 [Peredibacter starrii]